eukprot:363869-Chlamydomonas_euryale.AAC.19
MCQFQYSTLVQCFAAPVTPPYVIYDGDILNDATEGSIAPSAKGEDSPMFKQQFSSVWQQSG